jgi:hypothetical protein
LFNWLGKMLAIGLKVSTEPTVHRAWDGAASLTVMPAAGRSSDPTVVRQGGIGPDVAGKLDLLVRQSSGSREDNQNAGFIFGTKLVPAAGAEIFVTTLAKCVRSVAPRLNVPFMTPRNEVSQI